ncbi:MAG: AbrB/MazE/SpoVT family DNA-binding domain-containing protein [Nanoarchaeota archaeon]
MEIVREIGEKGQVVIPIDIRRLLSLNPKSKVIFKVENNEVKIKSQRSPKEWLDAFLKYRKKGREFTLRELKRIEEESYDLP